ncbi:CinA family protein [Roseospirillum parvum]|uniref:Nicotinamide-nucleotide amidase n=1 Tax=Roseospirillum parvum TaxID=83401 RepID=A0A1G7YG78_9PROT|nr:CinA family protein [Roseospirillum parvum]SDG95295.1 nicotinamide-nucleotide amidase [Roseospirillum parvum]
MSILPADLVHAAEQTIALLVERDLTVTVAESCTGGLIAACLTAVPGASAVFERGFVTYANAAKETMLGVPAELIAEHGAVSEVVACAMAHGALVNAPAGVALAVTGIAGPGGGSAEKPVGLVHVAVARRLGEDPAAEDPDVEILHKRFQFLGDRDHVRRATVSAALDLLAAMLEEAVEDDPDQTAAQPAEDSPEGP